VKGKTVVVQIGNSDGKLSQPRFSDFVDHVTTEIETSPCQVHFFGGSSNWNRWQNVCWVLEWKGETEAEFQDFEFGLALIAHEFGQNSIALTVGETAFIKGKAGK
jgi:hypothetical protein